MDNRVLQKRKGEEKDEECKARLGSVQLRGKKKNTSTAAGGLARKKEKGEMKGALPFIHHKKKARRRKKVI